MRAKHTVLLLFLSFFFILSAQAQVPPVASAVGMTGVMKRDHTLTVTYTYTGTNPQAGTLIQWIRYDDQCAANPVNIGAGLTTYALVAADEGKHIGVRVTPRDNAGNLGTPVTYRPWSCTGASPLHDTGPNPVLVYNANCNNASGIGVPIPGNLIVNPTALCSPRSLDWQVEYTGINYRLPGLPARIIINWADGNTETLAPTLINANETNMAKQLWRVVRNHVYNYDAGSAASTTVGARCTYTMQATWGVGTHTGVGLGTVTTCGASGFQQQPFTVWDMEDNTALGTHDINHDNTSAGVQATPPAPLAASTENVNICQGDTRAIRLADATDFNCTPALENPQPNDQGRWVQFVYGTTSNVTAPGGVGGSIIINGVSYSAAQLPVYGRVIWQESPPQVLNPVHITDNIQMPSTGVALQQMTITMRTWNICNPFDQITSAGNGLSPTQGGAFNVFDFRGSANYQTQAQFPNTNNYFANSVPVTRNYTITIIDKPAPPTVPNRDICESESRQLSVSPALGGLTYRWYLTQADALANANVQATATTFTPTNGQAPAGQRRHFFVTATAGNNCVSDPTEVMLTRRPTLAQPTTITGPVNLCPSSNYSYTLPGAPGSVTITDAITGNFNIATEFQWTIPAGVGTLGTGQGTESITMTSAAAVGLGNISVVNRYVTPPATTSGDRCNSTARTLAVNVRARPTAGITPDPANICEGSTIQLNGNPVLPANAAGFTPSISSHTWGGNTGILDATNIQQPTVQASGAPGAYALTYVVTADFGNSVVCSSTVDNSVVNISASPTPASVGANQAHCGPLTSNPLGGSNPGVGTGTWTRVPGGGAGTISFSNANLPGATATSTAVGVYTLRWTVVNGTCTSSADITVDFGANPGTPDAGPNNEFCGLSGSLNAVTPPAGTTIAWTQVSGPGTTTFSATNVRNPTITATVIGVYEYRYTISSGTCTPQSDDVRIEFFPPATVQNVADFTSCLDAAVLAPIPLSGTFGGGAGNAHWERVTGNGTFTSNGTATGSNDATSPATDSYTPTAADFTAGSVQLRLITNDPTGPCAAVSDLVTITLDRRPTIVNAGSNFAVCAQTAAPHTATLAASAPDHSGQGVWSGPAGVTFGNVNSPTSTVSGLAIGPNTLTWTVRSARTVAGDAGSCANQQAQVIVTVNPLPVSNAIAPIVCQDILHIVGNPSIPQPQASNVDLNQFSAGLADLPGLPVEVPAGFEVLYFSDAGYTTQITAPVTITNGQQIYTRVRNTTTLCFTSRTITFTLRNQPTPTNHSVQICEDAPPGSLVASGINLTTYETNVTGGAANRNVEWYTDSSLGGAFLIPAGALPNQEQNYSITATTTLFAKIIDTTPGTPGCHSVAELRLEYQPRPNANTIRDGAGVAIGSTLTVCASNNLVFLQIDPTINPGSTYTWNVPTPPASPMDPGYFELLTGKTGFFIILRFPSLIPNPGLPISVTERLGTANCAGTTINTSIIVEGSPPAPVITGPATVCANSPVTYSVPFVSGDTYSWTVPPGATITSFPITNTISVQMSTFSGNVTVTVANSTGCVAPPSTPLGVTVITRPAMTSGPSNAICSGDSPDDVHTLTATLGGTTYRWEVISILGFVNGANVGDTDGSVLGSNTPGVANIDGRTLTNTSGVDAAVIYRVIPVSPPTSGVYCEGNQQNVTITIRPEPNLLLTPKTVCSDEPSNYEIKLATVGLPTGTQFTWSAPTMSDGSTQGTSGTNVLAGPSGTIHINDAFLNTSPGTITATYTISAVSGAGCISHQPVASRQVVITINPKPLISTTLDKPVCSDEAIALTLNTGPGTVTAANYTIVSQNIAGLLNAHAGNATVPQSNVAANYLVGDKFTNTSGGPLLVTYTVNARGSIGACQGPDQMITITVNTGPSTNVVTDEVCSDVAGGTAYTENLVNLQPLVNPNGTLTFQWFEDEALTTPVADPTAYPITVQNPIPRTGSVYVRVDNGVGSCAKVQQVTYVINPTPAVTASVTSNYSGFSVRCIGSADGTITANPATLGSPNYSYSVDGSNFFTGRVFNGLAFANNPFIVTVRDARGCTATSAPMSLTEPPVMTAVNAVTSNLLPTHNGRDLTCPGASDGQITVTAGGGTGSGYSYRIIETNATNTTGVFNGLPQGAYTVIVTDKAPNNCTITSNQVTITPPPVIVASATMSSPTTCNGDADGEVTVTASGGTLVMPTNYSFTIHPPVAGITNNTGIFPGLAASATPYVVTVRDANGCTVQSNGVVVTQPATLNAFASVTSNYNGSQISCNGANDAVLTVTANGGNSGYTYVFNGAPANTTGDANGIYTAVHPGSYTVTVTDAEGCQRTTGSVTVNQPSVITIQSFITNAISCFGDTNGQISLIATGGTGAHSYVRDNGPALNPGPETNTSGVFSNLAQFSYNFTVTDLNNCPANTTVVLNQPALLTGTAAVVSNYNGSHISCPSSMDGIVQVTGAGGTLPYNYVMFVPTTGVPNSTGLFNGLAANNYQFRITDARNCTVEPTVSVVAPSAVVVNTASVTSNYNGQDISCTNFADAEITITASGGSPGTPTPYRYTLNLTSNSTGLTDGTFNGVAVGSYTLTATDGNNCTAVSSVVTVDPYPVITFPAAADAIHPGGTEIRCFGESNGQITSTPSGGAGGWTNYTISPVQGTHAGSGVFTGLPAGTYAITARDVNNCPATTANVTVHQPDVLVASAAVVTAPTCFNLDNASVRASAVGGTVNYTFSINTTPSPMTSPAQPGPHVFNGLAANPGYIVSVTDVNGCFDDVTVAPIVAPSQPLITAAITSRLIPAYHNQDITCFGANDAIIKADHTAGTGTGTLTYTLTGPGSNTTGLFTGNFTQIGPGAFTVAATDINGCASNSVPLTVVQPAQLVATLSTGTNFNGFDIRCFNEQNGVLVVNSTGGTGDRFSSEFQYVLMQNPGNAAAVTPASPGPGDVRFNNLRAMQYSARVQDLNGCTIITPILELFQPTQISLSTAVTSNYGVEGTDISCVGANDGEVSVAGTIAGGVGLVGLGAGSGINDYTYTIAPVANTSGATSGVFTGLGPNTLLTVTATDANGCTANAFPVILFEPTNLFPGFVGSSHDICIDQASKTTQPFTQLQGAFGGNGSYEYQWMQSTGVPSDMSGYTPIAGATLDTYTAPTNLAVTTHYIRQVRTTSATSAPSCPTLPSNILTITVNQRPTVTIADPGTICQGTPFGLTFNFTGAAPFNFDYDMLETGSAGPPDQENGQIASNSRTVFINNYQEETTFTVTRVVDRNACEALPTTLVPRAFMAQRTVPIIKVLADLNVTSANPQCSGDPFTFSYTVDPNVTYTFTWPDGFVEVVPPAMATGTISRNIVSLNTGSITQFPIIMQASHTSCNPLTAVELIDVYPAIIPNVILSADEVCSDTPAKRAPIVVTNNTLGGNIHSWTVDRIPTVGAPVFDQAPPTSSTADDQTFYIVNTTTDNPALYRLRYVAANDPSLGNGNCSITTDLTVEVYRQGIAKIGTPKDPAQTIQHWGESDPADAGTMVTVDGNPAMNIDFQNSSSVIDSDFSYIWTFSNNNPNTPPETLPNDLSALVDYDFKTPGSNKRAILIVTNLAAEAAGLPDGCATRDEFLFTIPIPDLTASFSIDPPIDCLDGNGVDFTIDNQSTGFFISEWTFTNENGPGSATSSEFEPVFTARAAGRYRVTLTLKNANFPNMTPVQAQDRFVEIYEAPPIVRFDPSPKVVFIPDQAVRFYNGTVTAYDPINNRDADIRYQWELGDGTILTSGLNPADQDPATNHSPVHRYKTRGDYEVKLIATNVYPNIECSSETVRTVRAVNAGTAKVPNAFTPNAGGPNGGIVNEDGTTINDVFLPITKGIKEFQMQIFDRWGNLVFESKQQNRGWDGYDRNGNLMPAGVYVYKLVLRMANDERTTQVGDVTLIR